MVGRGVKCNIKGDNSICEWSSLLRAQREKSLCPPFPTNGAALPLPLLLPLSCSRATLAGRSCSPPQSLSPGSGLLHWHVIRSLSMLACSRAPAVRPSPAPSSVVRTWLSSISSVAYFGWLLRADPSGRRFSILHPPRGHRPNGLGRSFRSEIAPRSTYPDRGSSWWASPPSPNPYLFWRDECTVWRVILCDWSHVSSAFCSVPVNTAGPGHRETPVTDESIFLSLPFVNVEAAAWTFYSSLESSSAYIMATSIRISWRSHDYWTEQSTFIFFINLIFLFYFLETRKKIASSCPSRVASNFAGIGIILFLILLHMVSYGQFRIDWSQLNRNDRYGTHMGCLFCLIFLIFDLYF